ncbi:MAG: hypothetical protein J6B56_05360 [Clostridia bacterium]|nr:hypothetical protein [Clostridia bacterium]
MGDITSALSASLQVFEYAPEEVLPDDEEGKNHVALVESLVEGENGLNNPDSYLNEQIKSRQNGGFFKPKRDTLGSMGVDQGDELEKLFSLDSKNLSFLIQFINDNMYYIFTTEVDLGTNGNPNYTIGEEYISPVYRTVVERIDGIWVSQTSAKGYALSAYYEESNVLGNVTKIPSFAPDTWTAGTP